MEPQNPAPTAPALAPPFLQRAEVFPNGVLELMAINGVEPNLKVSKKQRQPLFSVERV